MSAAPVLQLLAPRSRGARIVGDIVDRAAERIDFEHRLALRRAAESACRCRTSCRKRARPLAWASFTHAPRGFCDVAKIRRPSRRDAPVRTPIDRQAGDGGHFKMHALAERIARHQHARQAMRQRVDDGDFEAEAPVVDQCRKVIALAQQSLGALGEPVQAIEQRRRCPRLAERFDRRSRRRRKRRAGRRRGRDCDSRFLQSCR